MTYSDRDDDRVTRGPFDTVNIDEDDTFDASPEDDESNSRGWILLVAVLLVLAALAGVIYFAYQQGREEGIRTAPPIVRADDGPEKVAPQDPGGMDIPHQDKQIFERITGDGEEADSGVERLLPPPEEPMTPAQEKAEAEAQTQTKAEAPSAPAASPKPISPPARTEPARPVEAAKPAPVKPAPSAAAAIPGDYVVQVGAFRNMTRANAEWSALVGRHGDLVKGYAPDIQEADLGEKGLWYRLRVAAFPTKDAAATLCGKLKAAGTDCLVRQR